jgi:hypothetical protein
MITMMYLLYLLLASLHSLDRLIPFPPTFLWCKPCINKPSIYLGNTGWFREAQVTHIRSNLSQPDSTFGIFSSSWERDFAFPRFTDCIYIALMLQQAVCQHKGEAQLSGEKKKRTSRGMERNWILVTSLCCWIQWWLKPEILLDILVAWANRQLSA